MSWESNVRLARPACGSEDLGMPEECDIPQPVELTWPENNS